LRFLWWTSLAIFTIVHESYAMLISHLKTLLPALWVSVLLSLGTGVATAQLAGEATGADLYADAKQWLDETLVKEGAASQLPLRMEISVGALDSRLKLAPCTKLEPYVPPGNRLWGKTRLGVRCLQGATKWNVFLPVTVKAFGPAWVVKTNVASGAVLTQADAMLTEVDWAEAASPVVANFSDWIGQSAARPLTTGQTLRQNMMTPALVFQAGAQIKVFAKGGGFDVATSGQAVSAGVMGQTARVRMDNGRVVSGVVMDARTVRLDL
jgi:flagella basal body P-ring formation protein FlgA